MIHSMTGYGRAEVSWQKWQLVAELRSVNHRQTSLSVRLPRVLSALEDPIKKKIQGRFERGRIEISVSLKGGEDGLKQFTLNEERAESYHALLKQLQTKLELPGEIDIALMSRFQDLISVSECEPPTENLSELLDEGLKAAMSALEIMREEEGRALAIDLRLRLSTLSKQLALVQSQEKAAVHTRKEQLAARVLELTEGLALDETRLAQEVALFAERSDISEERTRLQAHIDHFEKMIETGGVVGRSLDFLLQEMNREVNTLSSKSSDLSISMEAVSMKSELEKMREQVQNVV